ncbi:MAG: Gfo/Idh/MocA family oxidoreductase [Fimbriimonadales bacterium]|nr:Gfo/Idh/MocA family oxidoreductase [Fimbriimonadales bacterium]
MIRLGYVGAGYMAQAAHLPNFTALPDCEVVALAELRPQLGERVAQRFGIPRLYRHHTELLADPDIDAVAVSAHFSHQAQVAEDALRAGKSVFMEKPIALNAARAERLLHAEQESGARLMVGYMKRYDAGWELAKRLVDEYRQTGAIGDLFFVRLRCHYHEWTRGDSSRLIDTGEPYPPADTETPDWLPPEYQEAFVNFTQLYCHHVNLLRWMLGEEAEWRVVAVDLDSDGMTGAVVLRIGDVCVVMETGAQRSMRWDEHLHLDFRRGWIRVDAPQLMVRNTSAQVEVCATDNGMEQRRLFPPDYWSWSYQREAQHFIECLRTGAPFRTPGRDAFKDIELIEAIYRHWLQGA